MQKLILVFLLSNGLFATDCIEYQAQQIKYEEKAEKNKLMSKRYNIIAERYKTMYNNCIEKTVEKKSDIKFKAVTTEQSRTDYIMSLSVDDKESPKIEMKQKVAPAVKSYRVNPYNTVK